LEFIKKLNIQTEQIMNHIPTPPSWIAGQARNDKKPWIPAFAGMTRPHPNPLLSKEREF